MKEGNLSPPVLAKNKGTEVFRLVSAAKAKLARACPIPCLHCIGASLINEYSPSLSRGEFSESVSTFQTYSPEQILIFLPLYFLFLLRRIPPIPSPLLEKPCQGQEGQQQKQEES